MGGLVYADDGRVGYHCIRRGEFTADYEMCDRCMDELDRLAVKGLYAYATSDEINEWCWQHDIKQEEERKEKE